MHYNAVLSRYMDLCPFSVTAYPYQGGAGRGGLEQFPASIGPVMNWTSRQFITQPFHTHVHTYGQFKVS